MVDSFLEAYLFPGRTRKSFLSVIATEKSFRPSLAVMGHTRSENFKARYVGLTENVLPSIYVALLILGKGSAFFIHVPPRSSGGKVPLKGRSDNVSVKAS